MGAPITIKVPAWLMPTIVGLIATAAVSTAAWAFNAEGRLTAVETVAAKVEAVQTKQQSAAVELATINTRLGYIDAGIKRIEASLAAE